MKTLLAVAKILFVVGITNATLSPPTEKHTKNKNKFGYEKGPVNRDVFERGLVVRHPKYSDIGKESGFYYKDTKKRLFTGEVLGYITPWNNQGLDVAKTFHGKLTSVSPVWFTIPNGSTKTFKLATHSVNKDWLKQIRDANTANHTLRILPRVLFEEWTPAEIVALSKSEDKQNRLVMALSETAKSFGFRGYVLEIWNQFVFTDVKMNVVVSLIKSLGERLKRATLDVVLAIPPARGPAEKIFSRAHFVELSPHIKAFSLMTYDYSSIRRPGPNSPLNWTRDCIEMLVPDSNDPLRAKILMGINFYGNNFTPEGGGPIFGSDYFKLLENCRGKIEWDDTSKEHFFEAKVSVGTSYVFYPTLYSINHRIELARELGTGISIWELGQGLNYFYDLL